MRSIICDASCQPFNQSFGHLIIQLFSHSVTWSLLSSCHHHFQHCHWRTHGHTHRQTTSGSTGLLRRQIYICILAVRVRRYILYKVQQHYILKRNETSDWSYFIWIKCKHCKQINLCCTCTGHFVVVFLRHCLLISQIYNINRFMNRVMVAGLQRYAWYHLGPTARPGPAWSAARTPSSS